jgi:uncharacterized protein
MGPVIIVMVKAPLPGLAKTRLSPPLAVSDAGSLALCFVQDVVSAALSIKPNLIVAFTPPNGRPLLEASLPGGLQWIEQQGQTLGERLISAVAHAYDMGFGPIIVLGADSPTLPPAIIEKAAETLSVGRVDVVLGPTADGGYYLVGLRKPEPQIFQNIVWSSPYTCEQTARNIRQLNLRLLMLDEWYDVDTFADLKRLSDELLSDNSTRLRAPQTYHWLDNHRSLLND